MYGPRRPGIRDWTTLSNDCHSLLAAGVEQCIMVDVYRRPGADDHGRSRH